VWALCAVTQSVVCICLMLTFDQRLHFFLRRDLALIFWWVALRLWGERLRGWSRSCQTVSERRQELGSASPDCVSSCLRTRECFFDSPRMNVVQVPRGIHTHTHTHTHNSPRLTGREPHTDTNTRKHPPIVRPSDNTRALRCVW